MYVQQTNAPASMRRYLDKRKILYTFNASCFIVCVIEKHFFLLLCKYTEQN